MLTDVKLRSLPFQESGQKDYPDRDGLFVRVGVNRKTFIVTITGNGRRKRTAIGHYPDIGLAAARAKAKDLAAKARLAAPEPETLKFGDALKLFETLQL